MSRGKLRPWNLDIMRSLIAGWLKGKEADLFFYRGISWMFIMECY